MENYSIPDIIEEVKSGIIHIIHVVDGKRVSSGTGFMVNGCLVTNYHVMYQAPKESKIILRTYDSDPKKPLEGVIELDRDVCGYFLGRTNKGEIDDFIKTIKSDDSADYAVYNIPELREKQLYNFCLETYKNKIEGEEKYKNTREGEEILFIGYHFDSPYIVSHRGFISSLFTSKGIDKIQIDASVNSGSSGSPLIDPKTSKVIGIVTRKATGLSNDFGKVYEDMKKTKYQLESHQQYIISECEFYISSQDRLISQQRSNLLFTNQSTQAIQQTIQTLQSSKDVLSSLTTNLSESIKELSKIGDKLTELATEIERSANVGIGYAYSVEHLLNENFYTEK